MPVSEGVMQKPFEKFQSIEMLFKSYDLQTDFKVLSSIKGDRVRRTRFEVVHNTSGILCSIQVSSSSELAESSQIIRNCIMHSPICKQTTQRAENIASCNLSVLNRLFLIFHSQAII